MEAIKTFDIIEEIKEWLQKDVGLEQNIVSSYVKTYRPNEFEHTARSRFKSKTRTHCMKPAATSNFENSLRIEYPAFKFEGFDIVMTRINCSADLNKSNLIKHEDTTKFPFSTFGLLIIDAQDGQCTFGVGVLIDENKVLTAFQNIWDKTRNKLYSTDCIYFHPGFSQNITHFGAVKVVSYLLPHDYDSMKDYKMALDQNFAILMLSEVIGKKFGYLGLEVASKSELTKQQRFSLHYSLIPQMAEEQHSPKQSACSMVSQTNLGTKLTLQESPQSGRLISCSESFYDLRSYGIVYYYNDKSDQYYVVGLCCSNKDKKEENCKIIPVKKAEFDHFSEWQYMTKENITEPLRNYRLQEEEKRDETKELELLKIDLSFKELDNNKMEALSRAAVYKLGQLVLSGCNIDAKTAKIMGLNKSWTNLEYLDLCSSNICDEHAVQLGTNDSWQNLKKLVLDSNKIGNVGAIALGRNVTWSKLETLVLSNNKIGCQGAAMIATNRCWKDLKKLILAENMIQDKGAAAIGKNVIWTNLEELNLNSNKIEDEGAVIIGKNTFWKKLKKLGLSDNIIGDEGVIEIAKNKTWTDLRFLDLHSNQVGNKGAVALARNPTWYGLRVLGLTNNSITHEGGITICRNNSWPSLEGLYLGCNLIKSKSVCVLAENITWKNLIKLELSMSEIDNEGAISIGNNETWMVLEELILSNNSIGDEGAIAIARNIHWRYLRILDLSTNLISDRGAIEIGKNKSWIDLEQLRLSGNTVRYKGAVTIASNSYWENIEAIYIGRNQKLALEEKKVLKYCTLHGPAINTRI